MLSHNQTIGQVQESTTANRRLHDTVTKACLAAKNSHPSSSVHHRQIVRASKPMAPAPYPTWDSLPQKFKDATFFDTVYVEVALAQGSLAANGLLGPTVEERKAVTSTFPKTAVHASLTVQKQKVDKKNPGNSFYKGMRICVMAIKTHDWDFEEVLEFINPLKDLAKAGTRWMELPGGHGYICLLNYDITLNFPGAVRPTEKHMREDIFVDNPAERRVPKDNIKYNGLQCITWARPNNFSGKLYARTEGEDLDGVWGQAVIRTDKEYEVKVYDKVGYTLSTTSVEAPSGNNLTTLAYSSHWNIRWGLRQPEIQLHGFGRMEPRCTPFNDYETKEDYLKFMGQCYEEVIPYCHSEPIAETLKWWYDPKATQVALARFNGINYNVAIVRTWNSYTNKYQVESIADVSWEEVKHFLLCTKLAHMGLVLYVESQETKNHYRRYTVGETKTKPNLSYLRKDRYTLHGCRAKWANVNPAEVPFLEGFFELSKTYIRTEETLPIEGPDGKQPDLKTLAQGKRELSDFKAFVKVECVKIRARFDEYRLKLDWKKQTLPFSDAPATGLLVGVRVNRKGGVEFALLNREGNVSNYRANTALEQQLRSLAATKDYTKHPIQFYKGTLSRMWAKGSKELEVYAESYLVIGSTEDACCRDENLEKYQILHWDNNDIDRYRNNKYW